MPKRKMFDCPAKDCQGGDSRRLYSVKDPSIYKIPDELRAPERTGKVLYRCSYCGFLWYQKPNHRAGRNPIAVGFYDNVSQPNEFFPAPDHPLNSENISYDEEDLDTLADNNGSSSGTRG